MEESKLVNPEEGVDLEVEWAAFVVGEQVRVVVE